MKQPALRALLIGFGTLSFCTESLACSIASPPPPPPHAESESDAEYAARAEEFRRIQWEKENARYQKLRIERENGLWSKADQVFVAKAIKYARASIMAEGGYRVIDKIVTLKPTAWLRGKGSRARFKLKPISFNSCDHPGNGQATEGEKGDRFLVFAKRGKPTTRTVLYTISLENVESERSKLALASLDAEKSE